MKNRKILILAGLVILIILVLFMIVRPKQPDKSAEMISPTPQSIIPTVDSSVKVDLESVSGNKEVVLTINNIPKGTQSIDYELSYATKSQGLQGIIGTIQIDNENEYKKTLTLGTCSSGTCVYHQVSGPIKVTLRFNGTYGQSLFEKDYQL
ncbi:MAG: hypothetical protein QHH09_03030 [Microgenomates group bacterium]|nr:hypothetical protein [Microgenomates group bacterium]